MSVLEQVLVNRADWDGPEVPEGAVIVNAPRPLTGVVTWEGKFRLRHLLCGGTARARRVCARPSINAWQLSANRRRCSSATVENAPGCSREPVDEALVVLQVRQLSTLDTGESVTETPSPLLASWSARSIARSRTGGSIRLKRTPGA
jgi:hypothetical protein